MIIVATTLLPAVDLPSSIPPAWELCVRNVRQPGNKQNNKSDRDI